MNEDESTRMYLIEQDMAEGTKRPSADLAWYIGHKEDHIFRRSQYWRHVESGTVYLFLDCSLACTGKGTLALMVRYAPLDNPDTGAKCHFERLYGPFMEKFEPVRPETVWGHV